VVSATLLIRELQRLFNAACAEAGIPSTARHYIGTIFTPPEPLTLHARETLISGAEFGSSNAIAESVGIYQVDVTGPLGKGTREVTDAADIVRRTFARGGRSSTGGFHLAIDAASLLAFNQDARSITLPVSITYRTWRTA
jgi:hypothetical protein